MKTLVLVRHGQSEWNLENRFTGWTDVGLTPQGEAEAKNAGLLIKKMGLDINMAFVSVLRRAIKTLHLLEDSADLLWLPEVKSWRLNERHYGALQGLNKAETAKKYGDRQVKIWRRSFDVRPPALDDADPRNPRFEKMYAQLGPKITPLCESLKDTIARTLPFWKENIKPALASGKNVLVAAHGNSLRGLIKYIENISDDKIVELEIPTGVPQIVELTDDLRFVKRYSLS